MNIEDLSAAIAAAGASDAASRRAVYARIRRDLRAMEVPDRFAQCLSLEEAIGTIEARAMGQITRRPARPVLIVEDYEPPSKNKIAA